MRWRRRSEGESRCLLASRFARPWSRANARQGYVMSTEHSAASDEAIMARVWRAWELTPSEHMFAFPASETDITRAEEELDRKLPVAFLSFYRRANGARLLGVGLQMMPLDSPRWQSGMNTSVIHMADSLRRVDWIVDDEVVLFASNGGEEHFGLWVPRGADARRGALVVCLGEVEGLAVYGTSFPRFLLWWTAAELMTAAAFKFIERPIGAYEALALPPALASQDDVDNWRESHTAWADPDLPTWGTCPYANRASRERIRGLAERLGLPG